MCSYCCYSEIGAWVSENSFLCSIECRIHWFDYGNCNYESENSNGYFDIDEYKEDISVGGECSLPDPYGCDYGFPTRWLWEDFEEEAKKEIENFK